MAFCDYNFRLCPWLWSSQLPCWRGPCGKKLMVTSRPQPTRTQGSQSITQCLTDLNPAITIWGSFPSWSFRWDPKPARPLDCSPVRILKQRTHLRQDLDLKVINVYCSKMPHLGVACYTAIDNEHTGEAADVSGMFLNLWVPKRILKAENKRGEQSLTGQARS